MKYTEKYVLEMIEYCRYKINNSKSEEEYNFYISILDVWEDRLYKIRKGEQK